MKTSPRLAMQKIALALLIALLVLSACAPAAAPTAEPSAPAAAEETAAEASTASEEPAASEESAYTGLEAPRLAEMVAAGELPPLEERLPAEPLVLQPESGIGQYGGTVRVPHAWDQDFTQGLLQRLHTDRDEFLPQIARDWEWADDFTSITFYLREGAKWSDGEPYTADDIIFWWDDIVTSPYNLQQYGVAGMNSATDSVVKVDDYTVRYEFAEPRPNFLIDSRGGWGYGYAGYAAHYFKQFHPDYNDALAANAQEAFDQLKDRIGGHQYIYRDADAPTLNAWTLADYAEKQYALFERNPYYFGVDPEGHQLPYIDYIESADKYDEDAELLKVQMLAGDADVLFRVVRPADYPLFQERAEELGIQVILLDDIYNGRQSFSVNQNYTGDEAIAELLQTVDFRRALSLALDRELMNESIYLGLGQPGHGFSASGEFDEAIDGAYATRDVDAANALLDGIGLNNRDGDGFRTLPDGSPLTITLIFRSGWGTGADDTVAIAVDNWSELGLRVNARPIESRLRTELMQERDWQLSLHPYVGGWAGYFLQQLGLYYFAADAADWVLSATEAERRGVEPEGELAELAEIQSAILASQDSAEMEEHIAQYRAILADQLYEIGTVANVPSILVLNSRLRNVPGQDGPSMISQGESEYLRVEQWYFAD